MLPTRNQHLDRGKKAAISSMLKGVGRDMIACQMPITIICVRAQPSLPSRCWRIHTSSIPMLMPLKTSNVMPGLHETCVDGDAQRPSHLRFRAFSLSPYSRTIWPLFLWHMLFYVRHRKMSMHFDMAEFDKVIMLPSVRIRILNGR